MKKHQLLLLVLLFTSNGLLITKNPENIHPASIRNIEKSVDESSKEEKHNPATHSNPASIKNYVLITEKGLCAYCEQRKKEEIQIQKFLAVLFTASAKFFVSALTSRCIAQWPLVNNPSPGYQDKKTAICLLSMAYVAYQLAETKTKTKTEIKIDNYFKTEKALYSLITLAGLLVGGMFP